MKLRFFKWFFGRAELIQLNLPNPRQRISPILDGWSVKRYEKKVPFEAICPLCGTTKCRPIKKEVLPIRYVLPGIHDIFKCSGCGIIFLDCLDCQKNQNIQEAVSGE